jgi:NADPH:quinone reductase-like Zn-dependent oxidoreductase
MDAVVLREFGAPDQLRFGSFPDPVAAPGWVVVRLRASSLNWHDVLVRRGVYSSPLPHVLGADGAGERTDTGEPVLILPSMGWGTDERVPGPGFQILGDQTPGTYAELVCVPGECVVPKPAGLSWAQAAALPLVGVTCFRALFSRGRLTAGESVLLVGAGGGVATMALSLAVAVGADVVVASSTVEKIEQARGRGAVGGVRHTDPDWVAAARDHTPGARGFDLVLDPVGRWSESVRALRPGGRLVVLGASNATRANLDIRSFYFGQFDLLGTTMGSPRDFIGLLSLMRTMPVAPPAIDTVFPLDAADKAHERIESGAGFGKIVLSHDQ